MMRAWHTIIISEKSVSKNRTNESSGKRNKIKDEMASNFEGKRHRSKVSKICKDFSTPDCYNHLN